MIIVFSESIFREEKYTLVKPIAPSLHSEPKMCKQ